MDQGARDADEADAVASDAVAAWLRAAFARVGGAPGLTPEERGRWQKRLLTITNAAKRDLPRAAEQTRHFDRDWDAHAPGAAGPARGPAGSPDPGAGGPAPGGGS